MRKSVRRKIACPNDECAFHKKLFKGNIKKNGFRKRIQNYKCVECGIQFVETYGTPLYRRRLKKKEIARICDLFAEKLSFRAVARVTHHKLDTIRYLAEDMANHAKQTNEFFLHDLKLTPIEVDEIWTFVKKNKKNLPKNIINSVNREMRILTSL